MGQISSFKEDIARKDLQTIVSQRIKNNLYLFFNEHDYFYVGDLRYKYHLSQLKDYIERLL